MLRCERVETTELFCLALNKGKCDIILAGMDKNIQLLKEMGVEVHLTK